MDIIYLNGTHIRVNALWMVKTKNTCEKELNDYFCTHCNSIVLILQGTCYGKWSRPRGPRGTGSD